MRYILLPLVICTLILSAAPVLTSAPEKEFDIPDLDDTDVAEFIEANTVMNTNQVVNSLNHDPKVSSSEIAQLWVGQSYASVTSAIGTSVYQVWTKSSRFENRRTETNS